MVLTHQFLFVWFMNFFSIFYGYFLVSTFKDFGLKHIKSDNFLTAVGACASVFGGMRWVWSYFVDRSTYKRVYGILLITQTVLSLTISFTNSNEFLYFVWVCASLFCEGGHFTLLPAVSRKIFGRRASDILGLFLIFPGMASILSSVLVAYFLKELHYTFFYFLGGGFTMLAGLLLFFFEEKKLFD